MNNNPLQAYKQTRIKTASGGKLIVMLYDEAIRQLELATSELNDSKPKLDKVHNSIVKAQDIITELTASLDFEKGGEIARNLFNLYMFFNQKLVDANIQKDASGLMEVNDLMSSLREAWASIESTPAPGSVVSPGVNIAG